MSLPKVLKHCQLTLPSMTPKRESCEFARPKSAIQRHRSSNHRVNIIHLTYPGSTQSLFHPPYECVRAVTFNYEVAALLLFFLAHH